MRLDACNFDFLSGADWRILHAIESESKTHEIVPIELISRRTKLDPVLVDQACGLLARFKLLRREGAPQGASQIYQGNGTGSTNGHFDVQRDMSHSKYKRRGRKGVPLGTLGYILAFGGLDYLALRFFRQKRAISSLSNSRLGVGKEADIHVGERISTIDGNTTSQAIVVKFHRLGRTSFRSVRSKRDYHLEKGSIASSWMHLSMLAAAKEWTFLKALHDIGFSVPMPVDHNRHAIVMERIDGLPLNQIVHLQDPQTLYHRLISMIFSLAQLGLVHGDFNEFNILIKSEDESPILIDFPQMVSIKHRNATEKWFRKNFSTVELDVDEQNYNFVLKLPAQSTFPFSRTSDALYQFEEKESGEEERHAVSGESEDHSESDFISAFDASEASNSSESCYSDGESMDSSDPDDSYSSTSTYFDSVDSESFEMPFSDSNRKFPPPLSKIIKALEETGRSPLGVILKASGYTHGLWEESDKHWGFLAI